MVHGRSLELFFINGRPDGMLTAEMFGWTGHILVAPRLQIADALKREQAGFTGVYLLTGETENGPRIYIDEGESIAQRIKSHDTQKDWWTKAIFITSASNNLNKAHVKYLESRLVEEAVKAQQYENANGNTPPRPSLSEAAKANMEAFLDDILIVMPAIGIDAFLLKRRASVSEKSASSIYPESPIFVINSPQLGLSAEAILQDGEFVVQAGSTARDEWQGAPDHGYSHLFEKLVETGVLRFENGKHVFTTSYAFQSPSAASAIIYGTARNGQKDWKHKTTGQIYRDWEKADIERLV